MTGEGIEAIGAFLSLIGVVIGVVVSAGILVHISAPLWLWLLYIVEMILIFVGVVMRVIGEHL